MKPITCIFLLATCIDGYSQLVLNAGDIWSYQFSSLPFTGMISTNDATPVGVFRISATSQNSSMLFFSLYENSLSETPLGNYSLLVDPSGGNGTVVTFNAWQDVQGAVRLQAFSGPISIDTITIQAITASTDPAFFNFYEAHVVAVPEPNSVVLLGGGLVAGMIFFGRRHFTRISYASAFHRHGSFRRAPCAPPSPAGGCGWGSLGSNQT